MTGCTATLGPLTCTRVTVHEPHHGCTFESTSAVASQEKSDGGGSDE